VAPDVPARGRGERLITLRHITGLTQGALAGRLGVTQSFVSHVERGIRPMPDSFVIAAAREFQLPETFFTVQPSPSDTGTPTFRKSSRATARDEERVTALYGEAARVFSRVSEASNYARADLPDPAEFAFDAEVAAEALRSRAGLPAGAPVLNVTRTLERLGIGVVDHLDSVNVASAHVGVSRPSPFNDRPLVALATELPGAVKRLTLLHEACHLIFDRELSGPITSTRSPEEKRAFRFAGAFLLPAEVVRERVSESLNLHAFLPIKADYGISVGAILRRSRDLGVISSGRYRSLTIQWSSQGWRANEPVPVADERPLLFGQALRKVFGSHPVSKAANNLGVSPAWINRWIHADDPADDAVSESSGSVIDLASRRQAAAFRRAERAQT
jgi:Zn-dependent peptidase ImmA (M78 family)/transcriptional regulator with XRE-family HTH domain